MNLRYQCDCCHYHHPIGIACPWHYPSESWARRFTFRSQTSKASMIPKPRPMPAHQRVTIH